MLSWAALLFVITVSLFVTMRREAEAVAIVCTVYMLAAGEGLVQGFGCLCCWWRKKKVVKGEHEQGDGVRQVSKMRV
jgi:hypothetical protein